MTQFENVTPWPLCRDDGRLVWPGTIMEAAKLGEVDAAHVAQGRLVKVTQKSNPPAPVEAGSKEQTQ